MARLIQGLGGPTPIPRNTDPLTDLTRLLDRLQQTILRADAERERRFRTSEFERAKASNNIGVAQSLLAKLGQDALSIKVHTRRQELQADLTRKRTVLEQLTERMRDLEELALAEDEDEEMSCGEDILGEIMATPRGSLDSKPAEAASVSPATAGDRGRDATSQDVSPRSTLPEIPISQTTTTTTTTTTTSQSLRPRAKELGQGQDTAASTAVSLFGDRKDTNSPSRTTATTEAILDHQRAEQEELYESLARMASNLKASSKAFATTLEEDKDVINRAAEGLNKNEQGLDAASRRMGTLRRMTEGKGWWGRMLLYAWVYGLMVVLVLVVFVMPKLRFSTW